MVDVVVIGAGPYGLSVAAHLRHSRIPFRVFGKPMSMWKDHMPKDLTLKSDAFASNLSAPGNGFPLERFYRETGRPDYSPIGLRVRADTLAEYGEEFQRRHVGDVDEARIVELAKTGNGFSLTLDTGEQVTARKVVVATGLLSLRHVPHTLASLPPAMLSHSSAHHDLSQFAGRRVTVLGAGQSACELSALLNEQGAEVTMLTRRPLLWFEPKNEDQPNARRSTWQRVRRPNFGLGPGWRTWFWSEMPYGFTYLPQGVRHTKAYTTFGPAGSGWIKHRVDGIVPIHTGSLRDVRVEAGEARLSVDTADGPVTLSADHVIAATGYRADARRLPFLDRVQHSLLKVGGAPVLNRSFESSVPGLHFVGYLGASTFGPSMRFIYGTRFAASQVSRHLSHLGAGQQRAGRLAMQPARRAGASV
ncbi:MAG: NAD(P)/FAD-dependent oxidoreductase [Pseudomonadota bacterium]|nr:NAD(P)/FAD-dependent oxidoreductase [Pseudomonadota bacterium]